MGTVSKMTDSSIENSDTWQNAGVLVVGGTSGLGEATAREFARAGAIVTVAGRNSKAGERIAKSIEGHFCTVDVTVPESIQAALKMSATAPRGLRAVVNAAGSAIVEKTLHRGTPHQLDSFLGQLQTNLVGSFNVLRLGAQAMAENEPEEALGRGVIILTSSVAGFEAQRGQVAYAAAKGGINSMILPAARDLARDEIRVFGVAPGVFDTPFMDVLSEDARNAVGNSVPHPSRLGKATEFSHLVVSLATNPMVNGEVVRLDGALRLG